MEFELVEMTPEQREMALYASPTRFSFCEGSWLFLLRLIQPAGIKQAVLVLGHLPLGLLPAHLLEAAGPVSVPEALLAGQEAAAPLTPAGGDGENFIPRLVHLRPGTPEGASASSTRPRCCHRR